MSDSLLTVKIAHRIGALALDIDFAVRAPWTVLFGASGSGKTTVLRAIAGFVRPDAGRIAWGTDVLVEREPNQRASLWVPAYARAVRSASQSARLFPHMSVRRNVQYGMGAAGAAEDIEEVMGMFRLLGLAERMPRELSGGERERISAARALFSASTLGGSRRVLLLLDEPFAGLHVGMRDELLVALKGWVGRRGITVISVTHDVGEAFHLGAEVIKIDGGKVVTQGPVGEVLRQEREMLLRQLALGAQE